jgi:hypothetical protein
MLTVSRTAETTQHKKTNKQNNNNKQIKNTQKKQQQNNNDKKKITKTKTAIAMQVKYRKNAELYCLMG